MLTEEEAKGLLLAIDTAYPVGLRDRAVIAVMVYSFARVSATVGMNVEDYFLQGKRWILHLREKRGRFHRLPAHPKLEEFLDAYLDAAGIRQDQKRSLFRTAAGKRRVFAGNRMTPNDAWRIVRRRTADANLGPCIGCHTFRATGITNDLEHGGTLDKVQPVRLRK
ncbi:MAG: tyrosine-type recombinase/integrase [Gemmataceae bacterium]|nr:tyrosine-type recombinase/integrase [Gemmataceae bacterium]